MTVDASREERPVAGVRIALTIVALVLNGIVIVLMASEPVLDVLLIAAIGLLPALLFAFESYETTSRRIAAAIAVVYFALAVVFIYPIGFIPAALCLLIAALAPARR